MCFPSSIRVSHANDSLIASRSRFRESSLLDIHFPGVLYFYLSAAAQLHTLRQISLLTGRSPDAVQTIRYAFDSNEVLRVPWYKIGGSFINFERPFGVYAFSTESPQHLSIVDIGVGPFATNDYTGRFFEHFNQVYNNPPKIFRTYHDYFEALIQTWMARTRPDQDDLADWGKETKEYSNLQQYGQYFPLPYRSVPKPERTDLTEKQSEFNPVFPYADLVYEYHRDLNYYRYARGWFLNLTQAEPNQNMYVSTAHSMLTSPVRSGLHFQLVVRNSARSSSTQSRLADVRAEPMDGPVHLLSVESE